jgi:hypothetical protein
MRVALDTRVVQRPAAARSVREARPLMCVAVDTRVVQQPGARGAFVRGGR